MSWIFISRTLLKFFLRHGMMSGFSISHFHRDQPASNIRERPQLLCHAKKDCSSHPIVQYRNPRLETESVRSVAAAELLTRRSGEWRISNESLKSKSPVTSKSAKLSHWQMSTELAVLFCSSILNVLMCLTTIVSWYRRLLFENACENTRLQRAINRSKRSSKNSSPLTLICYAQGC